MLENTELTENILKISTAAYTAVEWSGRKQCKAEKLNNISYYNNIKFIFFLYDEQRKLLVELELLEPQQE